MFGLLLQALVERRVLHLDSCVGTRELCESTRRVARPHIKTCLQERLRVAARAAAEVEDPARFATTTERVDALPESVAQVLERSIEGLRRVFRGVVVVPRALV